MKRLRSTAVAAAAVITVLSLVACAYQAPEPFTEAQVLGGVEIPASTLNDGREAYTFYCRACHGDAGDGRGPAAVDLITPPRDFRIATFKFTGTPEGYLPADEDLVRIVQSGLHGTAMLPWDVPEGTLRDIVHYLKTLSPEGEGFRDTYYEQAPAIDPGADPWGEARLEEAIARGRTVYHGKAECYSCHPAYETRAEINADRASFGREAMSSFRDRMWMPEAKASDSYLAPTDGDPACANSADCDGEDVVCHFGRCETKHRILPPDFTVNELRISRSPEDLYRIIAAGIPGTAMPTWDGALPAEDIWAMAHYVHHLAGWKGSRRAAELRERVRDDT